jgi:hypothetical protein
MPRGIFALSSHNLFSQFRGPRILNEEGAAPPAATPPAPPETTPPAPTPTPKPDDTEGRITELAKKNKELEKKLKEREDKDKQDEEERLKKSGEHEKLAEQYKNETATQKAAREAAEAKLAKYEELAQKQIDESIKGITDEAKRKSAKDLLEGLPVDEKMARLPGILTLIGGEQKGFGTATPPTKVEGAAADAKRAKFNELVEKEKKGALTPSERSEKHALMTELGKLWEEEHSKK